MAQADHIYEKMVSEVFQNGERRGDRTGTGTISTFGAQYRYDLRLGFPIITTKFVNFNALTLELLWFIRGDTNIRTLGSRIWDPWADENGELGPIYGKQWRNFGGVDQLVNVIEQLKTNPEGRRHIVSAWNPIDLPDMALPPCHLLFQFYRTQDGYLDLQMYQRSADVAVGVPFNVPSYSLLLSMVANELGITPRYFIHTIGDMHVYLNHMEKLEEQLKWATSRAPVLTLPKGKPVLEITLGDIHLGNYVHGPRVRYEVAV